MSLTRQEAHEAEFGPVKVPTGRTAGRAARPGRSRAASAYLDAIEAALPGWAEVTTLIESQDYRVTDTEVIIQAETDAEFLARLKEIDFPARAAVSAATLTSTLARYVDLLESATENLTVLHAERELLDELDEARAEASAALRRDLRLAPSDYEVLRP